jgi:hypothetical protein
MATQLGVGYINLVGFRLAQNNRILHREQAEQLVSLF